MITERAVLGAGARGPLAIGLAGLFAAATVMSVAAPAQAAEETVEQQIEKSILLVGTTYSGYVLVPYEDGDEWEEVQASSLCTGWFASPNGHIVTAGHCVDPEEGRSALLQQSRRIGGRGGKWLEHCSFLRRRTRYWPQSGLCLEDAIPFRMIGSMM